MGFRASSSIERTSSAGFRLPLVAAYVRRWGTVRRATVGFVAAAAIGLVLFELAFIVAPWACEGRLDFYFWSGVVVLVGSVALSFAARIGRSLLARVIRSAAFLVLAVGIWLAGLFAANVRIIRRLF